MRCKDLASRVWGYRASRNTPWNLRTLPRAETCSSTEPPKTHAGDQEKPYSSASALGTVAIGFDTEGLQPAGQAVVSTLRNEQAPMPELRLRVCRNGGNPPKS